MNIQGSGIKIDIKHDKKGLYIIVDNHKIYIDKKMNKKDILKLIELTKKYYKRKYKKKDKKKRKVKKFIKHKQITTGPLPSTGIITSATQKSLIDIEQLGKKNIENLIKKFNEMYETIYKDVPGSPRTKYERKLKLNNDLKKSGVINQAQADIIESASDIEYKSESEFKKEEHKTPSKDKIDYDKEFKEREIRRGRIIPQLPDYPKLLSPIEEHKTDRTGRIKDERGRYVKKPIQSKSRQITDYLNQESELSAPEQRPDTDIFSFISKFQQEQQQKENKPEIKEKKKKKEKEDEIRPIDYIIIDNELKKRRKEAAAILIQKTRRGYIGRREAKERLEILKEEIKRLEKLKEDEIRPIDYIIIDKELKKRRKKEKRKEKEEQKEEKIKQKEEQKLNKEFNENYKMRIQEEERRKKEEEKYYNQLEKQLIKKSKEEMKNKKQQEEKEKSIRDNLWKEAEERAKKELTREGVWEEAEERAKKELTREGVWEEARLRAEQDLLTTKQQEEQEEQKTEYNINKFKRHKISGNLLYSGRKATEEQIKFYNENKQQEQEQEQEEQIPEQEEQEEQKGEGIKLKGKPLNNIQIDKFMKKFNQYLGTYAKDTIDYNKIKKYKIGGFIVNTKNKNHSGEHWVAIYYNPNEINFYDSFGRGAEELNFMNIINKIKNIIKKNNSLIKFKENKIKNQKVTTANCGYFSMYFLINRFNGQKFSQATGFDELIKKKSLVNQKEKEIENFKNDIKNQIGEGIEFNYI